MQRSSGVLMSISSLPSPYGIGTLGKTAYDFVDFLEAAGQKYWQLLPLGPTSYGDSPYSALSSFAGNPYFIDLDELIADGLLKKAEVSRCNWGDDAARVDYGKVYNSRFKMLRKAYERGAEKYADEFKAFCDKAQRWLPTYALYMSVKKHFDWKAWVDWPEEDIRLHRPEAVAKYLEDLKDDVAFYSFIQFLFYRQWDALRAYAHGKGIEFIGDIPIYVAMDSADVWSEPQFFQLDEKNVPKEVAGVPPDAFTADGQLWGNPLYDWDKMKADGFGWWLRRIDGALSLYDIIRIDHFRGLESYWAVPYGDKTARNGHWVKGPGSYFPFIIKSWFKGIRVIAEDLGYVTPEVRQLLDDSGFPGMKILEFAFDEHKNYEYLPHNCPFNSVAYLGTHDNDTVQGWLKQTTAANRQFTKDYLNLTPREGWNWGLIRAGMSTGSDLFVMQMQDILCLGPECRMNTPGQASGNWQWRMVPGAITDDIAPRLLKMTKTFMRFVEPVKEPEKADAGKAEAETAAAKTVAEAAAEKA